MGIILREQPRPDSGSRTCLPNFKAKPPTRKRPRPTHTVDELAGFMSALAPAEVKALHYIAENGDLIIIADKAWLLTPAPKSLLDVLAAVGADQDDLEPDQDDKGVDDEPCDTPEEDIEPDSDDGCLAGDDRGTGGGSNDGHLIARKLLRAAGVL